MSIKNQIRDRLPTGRLKSYRRVGRHFTPCANWVNKAPRWYRNSMMNRPERREVSHLIHQIIKGEDADGIAFPVNHRPFVYYY